MATGTVKSYNAIQGRGFIVPYDGNKDVIVYKTAVESAGLRGLTAGQKIGFDIAMVAGKPTAVNLKAL